METTPGPDKSHIAPPSRGKVTLIFAAIVVTLAVLFVVGLLPHLRRTDRLAVESAQSRTEVEEVTVVSPHLAPSDALVLPGSVQAIEETTINARTTGFVRRRLVDIGSRVRAGQLLAEIESPEVDQQVAAAQADVAKSVAGTGQARADVAKQQATVAQMQSEVARQQANLGQSRAALKRTNAKLLQAQAATSTARAKLAQSRQALAGRQADLVQAQTQSTLAQRTWKRWQGLAKSGAVSRQEADEKEFSFQARQAAATSAEAGVHSAEADVEAAQANVASAEADVQAAQEDIAAAMESVKAASSMVTSSRSNVQAAQAGVNASQANVQATQAVTGSSQATTRRYAALQSFQRITAPFAGVITSRSIDAGSLVKADDSTTNKGGLFGLARTDVLRIMVSVPQTFAANMQPGQTTNVTVREFPGRVFTGTIARNAGALDPATRTLLTEIHVNNADGKLLPGTYAQVEFAGMKSASKMRIPANALVIGAEGTRVAIVTKANKVHFQPVVLGADYGQETEVVTGLRGDESLITNVSDDVKEGATVKPVPAPPVEIPGGPPAARPTPPAAPGSAPTSAPPVGH
jgi:RND family efflux transporter MFP subunit